MELHQIRYFLAVADTLSFTRASERAFVSQPALTKAIQRLEEAIGGRLFDRTRNTVQLTDLGREMLPSLRQIHASAVEARERARRLARGRGEAVRVGVMCTIHFDQVLPAFAASQSGRVEVPLTFRDGTLEALLDALDRDEIDLGLLCSPYEIPRRFEATPLFREDYVVAVGDDHRFCGRDTIEIGELHREHYCERTSCEFSTWIERLLRARGIALDVVHSSAREDWIQALVRANFGVAFMPASIARAAGLACVRTADVPIEREVVLLAQAGRGAGVPQQAVVDALTGHDWRRAA